MSKQKPEAVDVPIVKMHGLGNDFIMVDEPLRHATSHGLWPATSSSSSSSSPTALSPLLAALAATTHKFPSYVPPESRARSVWAGGVGHVASTLCARRFGVGADGLTLLLPPFSAEAASLPGRPAHHFRFELYNPDGSAAPMCGNALRCAVKLAWERRGQLLPESLWAPPNQKQEKKDDGPVLYIETPAGTMVAHLTVADGGAHVTAISINLGRPKFARSAVPCVLPSGNNSSGNEEDLPVLLQDYADADGRVYQFSSLVVGVPHTVVFVEEGAKVPLNTLGPALERDRSIFPQGTNVGFAQILQDEDNTFNYWAWERGVGETLACGTGASAAAVIAGVLGRVDPAKPIHAHLVGGDLSVRVDFANKDAITDDSATDSESDNADVSRKLWDRCRAVERVWMEGTSVIVFDGVARVSL